MPKKNLTRQQINDLFLNIDKEVKDKVWEEIYLKTAMMYDGRIPEGTRERSYQAELQRMSE